MLVSVSCLMKGLEKKRSALNGLEVISATGYFDFEQESKVNNSNR